MAGGEIFGDDEISLSNFRFLPQIFGGGGILLIGSKQPLQMAAARKAAAGIAAADQCRHLLICLTMCPRWTPAASFAGFCILIVLLYFSLQPLCRHGGRALFKSMQNSFVQGKFGITPQKWSQMDQNWEVGSSYGTNKPPSRKAFASIWMYVYKCCESQWNLQHSVALVPALKRILSFFLSWGWILI